MDLPNRHCFTAIAHANQSSDGDGDYDDCDDDVKIIACLLGEENPRLLNIFIKQPTNIQKCILESE